MGVAVLLGTVSGCSAHQAAAVPDQAGASPTPIPATTVCAKDAKAVGVPQELPAQAALPNGHPGHDRTGKTYQCRARP